MPSPFPGMDPYLEDPAIWPDLHDRLANEISSVLNAVLPRPYYARRESRPEVGIAGEDAGRPIVPDVSVLRRREAPARAATPGSVAVAERPPRTERTESVRIGTPGEPVRHHYVEIRDASRGHALVTLIEIVSPTNKRPGEDRKAYRAKQREVLDSDSNLIEIDLLSAGEPVVASPAVIAALEAGRGRSRYLVTVSRTWERAPTPEYELFPFGLHDPLPCISVPLREGEDEVLLDLQYVFDRCYDTGPYARGAVDYDEPPRTPLADDEKLWVRDRVAAAFPGLSENRS
ncbi:MAG TPA: DUF4058 family protein [Planctomycetaceae bacterium]